MNEENVLNPLKIDFYWERWERSGSGDENEALSDPGLSQEKKNSSFDVKPLHAVHKKPTIPSQKSCMYFPEFKIKKKKRKENKNSYLSRWLLIYRLMYNIDKLNRDQ